MLTANAIPVPDATRPVRIGPTEGNLTLAHSVSTKGKLVCARLCQRYQMNAVPSRYSELTVSLVPMAAAWRSYPGNRR